MFVKYEDCITIISDQKKKIKRKKKGYKCALLYTKIYYLMNYVKIYTLEIKTKSSNSK